jgi:tetratricopeptide (TPR) repeat protein
MIKKYKLIWVMLLAVLPLYSQNERKVIREGVRAYEEGRFAEAEVEFRKAESINQESYEAEFNTGTALYGQEKYEETVKQYETLLSRTDNVEKTARIWHNIGNSLLEARQYGPSIEAYKHSLRKDPTDEDTRYNLAYAKQKLQEQNQDKGEDQSQDRGKDQNEQDRDKNEDRQQDNQQEKESDEDRQQDEQEEPPSVPREISKEDAERMLKAIQQQEKDVKEKVDKKKAAAAKVKTEKDW